MLPNDKSTRAVPRWLLKRVHVYVCVEQVFVYGVIDSCDDLQVSHVICADDMLFHVNVCV